MAPSNPTAARSRLLLPVVLLLLAVGLRFPGIGNPPLDIHHVRQSDTASIARVMTREGIDVLRPRIGWAGPDAGTVESELPLYAAATAAGWQAAARLTPDRPMPYAWPRLVSALGWLLGGFALAAWVRRRIAGPVWPSLVLYGLSPLAVVFSRNIQPDALAIGFMLLALERSDRAGEGGGVLAALSGGLLAGVAVACKPQLFLLWPLVPALLVARSSGPPAPVVIASSAVAALLPAAWVWHAHVHLGVDGATFGVLGAGANKWGGPALWFDPTTWRAIGGTLLMHAATPAGLFLAGLGVAAARTRAEFRPFVLGFALLGAGFLVLTAGYRLHNYYQLAGVPFLSVLAAAGWQQLQERLEGRQRVIASAGVGLLVAASAAAGFVFVQGALAIDERIELQALSVGAVVPPGKAVAVVDRHPQSVLYAMDRRGFHRTTLTLGELVELESYGAEYLALSTTSEAILDPGFLLQLKDSRRLEAVAGDWMLFRLGAATQPAPAGDDDDSARAADDDDSAQR